MSYDLDLLHDRKALSKRIKDDIDAYAVKAYDDGHRSHLGASVIGGPCKRAIWYSFRWVRHGKFNGRMQRLFQRGHLEEKRYIEYLIGIGFQVWAVDENGKQLRVSDCGGHFGGSLDAVLKAPARYEIQQPVLWLGEFKTQGTGSKFAALLEKGLAVEKEQHWVQMCTYGYKRGYQYGCYFATNKNDDDMHVEVVRLDWNVAVKAIADAERIILTKIAPARVAETPAYWLCKSCTYTEVCHSGGKPDQNCRTCVFSTPVDGGRWFCDGWKQVIPDEDKKDEKGVVIEQAMIRRGCDRWTPIR